MLKLLQNVPLPVLLIAATLLETNGDAVVRMGIFQHTGSWRIAMMLAGALLLFGYGFLLNIAPVEFGRIVGLYIATLFVVWQVTNFMAFRALPGLPVLVGGTLIVAGGLIVTYWHGA